MSVPPPPVAISFCAVGDSAWRRSKSVCGHMPLHVVSIILDIKRTIRMFCYDLGPQPLVLLQGVGFHHGAHLGPWSDSRRRRSGGRPWRRRPRRRSPLALAEPVARRRLKGRSTFERRSSVVKWWQRHWRPLEGRHWRHLCPRRQVERRTTTRKPSWRWWPVERWPSERRRSEVERRRHSRIKGWSPRILWRTVIKWRPRPHRRHWSWRRVRAWKDWHHCPGMLAYRQVCCAVHRQSHNRLRVMAFSAVLWPE
mmetsp:Transcript_14860/g.26386  ORF Transcript_14860/g.26386 Transcript_14860/m.26386 type:complete len:253 (+) Transcript_14860:539-1297(+)